MTIYITQGHYSREAIRGMVAKPEDRAEAVADLVKAAGGKLLNYYVTFGEYDFLVVMESDKNLTDLMSVLFVAAATGGVTDLHTTVAVTSKEATKAMKQAKKIQSGFKAAGQAA
ncbi:GYD domain-containing protein [Pelagibius sp. CAU 1746]|uniref:GYD domain-containing protein n=1 Tax=Pelagibius sp. CAU 1746 TaxID=3140370 RepID=UPI00325B692E